MKRQWLIWGEIAIVAGIAGLVWVRNDPFDLAQGKSLVENEPFTVSVTFEDKQPRVDRESHMHVSVARDGAPFDLFGNGYLLHVIIASEDFRDFRHTCQHLPLLPRQHQPQL